MATIAPWIIPPNFAQIMESGAQTGLALRRQNQAESEAGDRLRLAYDTLASNERRASEAAAARRDAAMAATLIRQKSNDALQAYRAGMLREREASNLRQAANQIRLGEQFQQQQQGIESRFTRGEQRKGDEFEAREGGIESRFQQSSGQRASQFEQQQQRLKDQFDRSQEAVQDRFESREDRIREMYGEGQESAAERAELAADRAVGRMQIYSDLRELGDVKKQMLKIEETGGPKPRFFGLNQKEVRAYEALKKRKDSLEKNIEETKSAASGLTGRRSSKSNYARVRTQAEFDALQPGEVYVGAGGKLYQKPK